MSWRLSDSQFHRPRKVRAAPTAMSRTPAGTRTKAVHHTARPTTIAVAPARNQNRATNGSIVGGRRYTRRGDRARWGASGALYPQPALAGPMLVRGPHGPDTLR